MSDITHIITCLNKFSTGIRNPAQTERLHKIVRIDVSFYEDWDINHIKEKFCQVHSQNTFRVAEYLVERLGKANTTRRQLFESYAYSEKISKHTDDPRDQAVEIDRGEDILSESSNTTERRLPQTSKVLEAAPVPAKAKSQTTVSTIQAERNQEKIDRGEDRLSESSNITKSWFSQNSYTTRPTSYATQDRLPLIPSTTKASQGNLESQISSYTEGLPLTSSNLKNLFSQTSSATKDQLYQNSYAMEDWLSQTFHATADQSPRISYLTKDQRFQTPYREEDRLSQTSNSTQTTLATINPQISLIKAGPIPLIDVERDEDQLSQTSYASSTNYIMKIRVPSPPGEDTAFDGPFQCPYCFDIINVRRRQDWKYVENYYDFFLLDTEHLPRRHVFRDLQPYVCTFPDCPKADELYGSQREWFNHEVQLHRREWYCDACSESFFCKTLFHEHIKVRHFELVAKGYVEAVLSRCERAIVTDVLCPLCGIKSTLQTLEKHLGLHLQEVALFALPHLGQSSSDGRSDKSDHASEGAGEHLRRKPSFECDSDSKQPLGDQPTFFA